MKKSYFIIAILFAAALGAGVLIWERQQKEARETQEEAIPQPAIIAKDHVLARAHKTSIIDLDGPYKKVSVSNGTTTFSFEVPDAWPTETRNSGEVEMNEEELRDFLATDYFEDIRGNPDSVGNYRDLHWDDLKNMSLDEMKRVFGNLQVSRFPGPPNASVSGGRYISYMGGGDYQIDFYLLSAQDVKKYFKYDSRSGTFSKELRTPDNTVSTLFVDGIKATQIENKKSIIYRSGGANIFVPLSNADAASEFLVIDREGRPSDEFATEFDNLVNSIAVVP